jgi:hypothetical protein
MKGEEQMEFKVRAASIFIWPRTQPPTALIAKYPCLHRFGYEARKIYRSRASQIRDETGEVMQQVNYSTEYEEYINVDTFEQLIELQKAVDHELAVGVDTITIYDDYME